MKPIIKNLPRLLLVLPLMVALSCKKEPPMIEPIDDNSLPSAAILSLRLANQTATSVELLLDIAVFRDSRNVETNLKAGDFQIDTLRDRNRNYYFVRDGVNLRNAQGGGQYAALMLLDQSGSIASSDRQNYRIDAAKIFAANLGSGNEVALWSFPARVSWEHVYDQMVGFTTDTAHVIAEIESLRNKHGGGTPLYTSQAEGIDFVAQHATRPNKAILSFTDGADGSYGINAGQVAEKALANNIKLYNIGLGDARTEALLSQAVATDGGFMYAKDARQLISIFGNLGKLLDGSARFYQTKWTIKSDGNLPRGTVAHSMAITFPFGQQIEVPFTLQL